MTADLPNVACPRCGAGERFNHPEVGLMPGYIAGRCGHRVAGTEWRAGFRTCERCPDPGCPDCIHPHLRVDEDSAGVPPAVTEGERE